MKNVSKLVKYCLGMGLLLGSASALAAPIVIIPGLLAINPSPLLPVHLDVVLPAPLTPVLLVHANLLDLSVPNGVLKDLDVVVEGNHLINIHN